MAKNELLPFASGEDANVLPTNQWEALTDILENGFQSGIARSEQVNRVLSQGAVASYVLGQLIVDQLSKDATLDKDTLYQNLVSALQENAKDACLPLSGGTMTGVIIASNGDFVCRTVDNDWLTIFGGTSGDSSYLQLFGKDCESLKGFSLVANDGTNRTPLTGLPTGELIWGGKQIAVIKDTRLVVSGNNSIIYAPSGGTWLCFVFPWRTDGASNLQQFQWIQNHGKVVSVAGGSALHNSGIYDACIAWCVRIA